MRRLRHPLLLLTLFCIYCADVSAAITSDYEQEVDLQFAYGAPPVLQAFSSADTAIASTHFVALLGTLTVTTDGNTLFDPALVDMSFNTNLYIEGYIRPNSVSIQYSQQIPVYIRAISVAKNKVIKSAIIVGGNLTLGNNPGNVLGGSDALLVYLVLVNVPPSIDYFIPGTTYRLSESSNVGSFALEATSGGNTPVEDVLIAVNGSTPQDDAPFIGTGTGTPPPIPYEGDFDFTHSFDFTILSNPASFIISDALSGLKPVIASLQLQVINALPGNEYSVSIAFSGKDQSGFTLHLDGNLAKYGIPYRLFWGTEEIITNQLMTWRELFTQNSTMAVALKQISLSITDVAAVDAAPEGDYQDIVTVIIIPLDSI